MCAALALGFALGLLLVWAVEDVGEWQSDIEAVGLMLKEHASRSSSCPPAPSKL